MNAARQISRRFGRAMRARARSAADYPVAAILSLVPGLSKVGAQFLGL